MKQRTYYMIYDGHCPLCTAGAERLDVDPEFGELYRVNARKDIKIVDYLRHVGLSIEQGVIVMIDGKYVEGAEAVHTLAKVAPTRGVFHRCSRWLFGSEARARYCYSLFLGGRNLLLRLLGRKPVSAG